MLNARTFSFFCVFLLTLHASAKAQVPETGARIKTSHIEVLVGADGTSVQTAEMVAAVSSEQELRQWGSTTVRYNASVQEAEIIDAATIKASGEKIPVQRSAIFTQNAGAQSISTIQDHKVITIVFPKLEVGDSVYYRTKVAQRTAFFPGHFSFTKLFPSNVIWEDAQVTVTAPKGLPLRVSASGVDGGTPIDIGNMRSWTWTYKSNQAQAIEPGAVSIWRYTPRILVSSFKDYGEVALAYQALAKDKAKVTPATAALANEITKGITDKREQTKRLSEWVANNIRYMAIHLDMAGFVPNDAERILSYRYGDCKDHAVLLESLLTAKGIASTPVLIDSRPNYTLPEVATPEAFNHVITYAPAFDLYLDTTSRFAPFGVLPIEDTDKPVVHTANFTGIKRTPASTSDNASVSNTFLRFSKEGNVDGEIRINTKGPISIFMREFGNSVPSGNESVRQVPGTARLPSADGPGVASVDASGGIHSVTVKYNVKQALNFSSPAALALSPSVMNPLSLQNAVHSLGVRTRRFPYSCIARTVEENFEVYFPENISIVAIPKGVTVRIADATYQSTYRRNRNHISVTRKYVSQFKSNVCDVSRFAEQYRMTEAIVADLRAKILYLRQ